MAAKEKKGLGTGLGVLFGADEYDDEAEQLTLPIAKVEPRSEQPREYFDQEALEALADSIRQYGLIQPITVRKLDSGYYQIIAGERRWRASRLAGLTEVPVRVIEADDRRTAELALVENLQREDLNPIEEAKGYKLLIEEYGLTQEEAARSVGRSRPAVTNAMRLLMLAPQVMEMVEKGELSAGHARAILTVSEPSKQLAAANEIIRKNYSVRKAEQLAAKIFRESQQTKEESSEINVDYAAEVSNELSKKLGRKVRLIEGKRNGKIEIEFYSPEDLDRIVGTIISLQDRDRVHNEKIEALRKVSLSDKFTV